MEIPYVRGKVAAQAHVAIPDGTVEEEFARDGFFGRYAHLYREHAPVGWTRIEGPLRPRACLLVSLPTRVEEAVSSRGVFSFVFKGMGHHERLAVEPEADIFFRWGPVFGPKPRATDLAPALEAPTHLLCGGQY